VTRLLGVDVGSKRIGLAVGDTVTGAVVPLTTIRHVDVERDARTIATIVGEQRIDELVVGLPYSLDGSEGPQALATRDWASAIAQSCGLPLSWRDERMTTEDAIGRIGAQSRGRSGGPPSTHARRSYRARLDRLAAAAIAQAEVDARRSIADTERVQGDS
jgi:putative Holliday junction resolvase